MKLQSKKARVPIAALGVTALVCGAGALVSPAFAVGTTLAFGPTDTSATIVNVVPGTNSVTAGLTYGAKVTGISGGDPLYVSALTAPTGGALLNERVLGNGAPAANATPVAVTNGVGNTAVTLLTTAGSTAATLSLIPTNTGTAVNYSLAGSLLAIGTGAATEYLTVASHTSGTMAVVLATPAATTQATAALSAVAGIAATNYYVPVVAATSSPVAAYGTGDSIYFGAVVPGDYTYRLFQDHNGNGAYEAAQDDSTPTFTLHVKDVTNNTSSDTSDDLNFGLTTPGSVDLGQPIPAVGTLGGLTTVDTRGTSSSLGVLGTKLATATQFASTGNTTTVSASASPVFDGTNFASSFTTSGAAGTVDIQPIFDSNGSASFTGADYTPVSQKKNTTVGSNGVTAIANPVVTAVTGSVKAGTNAATIKASTTSATYSATVTDTGDNTDDLVYFTLTPGTNSPVLTSTGTLVSGTTGVKVYSALANASGVAKITVTSSVTTDLTTYTVGAKSSTYTAATPVTATYAAPVAGSFLSTNTATELNPTVPTSGTGSVVIKGKLLDQFGAGYQPASLAPVTIQVDVNNSAYGGPDVTGVATVASDGTFSYTYTPVVAPTPGQSDFIRFSLSPATPLATTAIRWASATAIGKITLTTPAADSMAATMQDNTAPNAAQSNTGTPPFGNLTGAVTGTVYDASNVALAYKAVTLSGGDGVYFATAALPDADHMLVKTLDVVSSNTGALTGAYVFFTDDGAHNVVATAGAIVATATVTTKPVTSTHTDVTDYRISTNDAAGAPGATMIVTGKVVDVFGNPVVGTYVDLSTGTSTIGALGDDSIVTNSEGVWSTTFISGSNQSGEVTLTAKISGDTTNPIPDPAYALAGLTSLTTGQYSDAGTIKVSSTDLTLVASAKVTAGPSGAKALLSGTFLPNTSIDIYAKASGAAGYSFIDTAMTDAEGEWGSAQMIMKSTYFLARSSGLSSPSDQTQVFSKIGSITAKALGGGKVRLYANGDPNAKAPMVFYRAVAGVDPKLKGMITNSYGSATVTVKLPKGTRYVYATYQAAGTGKGISKRIAVKVK